VAGIIDHLLPQHELDQGLGIGDVVTHAPLPRDSRFPA
jgi:hypothetical protein